MTQIATTVAISGVKAHGAGRAHGMKPGAGGDFAAIVAGLDGTADPAGAIDPDSFIPTEDAAPRDGADADAREQQGEAAQPVILDLALNAAAQSAMADMVVTPPAPVDAQAAGQGRTDNDVDALSVLLSASSQASRKAGALPRAAMARPAFTMTPGDAPSPNAVETTDIPAAPVALAPTVKAPPTTSATIPASTPESSSKAAVTPTTTVTDAILPARSDGNSTAEVSADIRIEQPSQPATQRPERGAVRAHIPSTVAPRKASKDVSASLPVDATVPRAGTSEHYQVTAGANSLRTATTPVDSRIVQTLPGARVAVQPAGRAAPVTPVIEQTSITGQISHIRQFMASHIAAASDDPVSTPEAAPVQAINTPAEPVSPDVTIVVQADVTPVQEEVMPSKVPAAAMSPTSTPDEAIPAALFTDAVPTTVAPDAGTPAIPRQIASDTPVTLPPMATGAPAGEVTEATEMPPVARMVQATEVAQVAPDESVPVTAKLPADPTPSATARPTGSSRPASRAMPASVVPVRPATVETPSLTGTEPAVFPVTEEPVLPPAQNGRGIPRSAATPVQLQPLTAGVEPAAVTTVSQPAMVAPPNVAVVAASVETPVVQVPNAVARPETPAAIPPEAPAAIPARTTYSAIQPVISALHRATPASTEARTADTAPMAVMNGETLRRNPTSSQDGNQDRSSGGSALNNDNAQAVSVSADVLPGGQQFADIIQSLPPIAQSRIGGASDVAPVVTGPADVGASLQGQAIDMTVGGQWIDRMAKEITALAQGTGHSRFQLSPPNLGRIQIDVWQGDEGGKVQLLTETDEAARHLRDGQSSLQADARLSALQLNTITIDRAPGSFDTPRDQSGQPQQQPTPQHRQNSDQGGHGAQTGTQTNTQGGGQQNSQQNAQTALQSGMQGGNSNGQGKSSARRDVLNHQADTVNQQGGTTGRDSERRVRYA